MDDVEPLPKDALRWQCDRAQFEFDSSDELEELDEIIGQERAVEAIEFGIGMEGRGYNLFALGPTGTGKYEIVHHFLEQKAASEPTPDDLCYVYNFENEREPCKLRLPAGLGQQLSDDMDSLIEDLKAAIPAAFESEDFQVRQTAIDKEFQNKQQETLAEIEEEADAHNIQILQTPAGIVLAPVKDGEVVPPDELDDLPEDEREAANEAIERLEESLRKELRSAPRWERKRREKLQKLRKEVAGYAVHAPMDELRHSYAELDQVLDYLDRVEDDIIENANYFMLARHAEHARLGKAMPDVEELSLKSALGGGADSGEGGQIPEVSFRRYDVNVMVDNAELEGAPVIYEDDPTLDRLIGQIEHLARFGALVTDFTLIRPGALHRANGGYLIIDVRKLLMHSLSWEQLKRALFSGRLHIESARQVLGLAQTVTLEPQAVDLDVKVVLLGERKLYYLLDELDHEFGELFKVSADFNDRMARDSNLGHFARLVAGFARREDCAALSPAAMAQVIERAARLAGDREKLSTHSESIRDLVRESSYWAAQRGHDIIDFDDVQRAVTAQQRRADRLRERLHEQIEQQTLLIDTDGDVTGQVNALSVLTIGNLAFGRPHRITASARVGRGEVVDIEREANLGGPLHAKGVLILSGFLGRRFGKTQPLSLTASLVFEQTYGGIDGDSASLAEVCALLSELAEAPIRQDLAITGSINQQGRVQAIGGVSEKIEGFFDICKQRGLTGTQGVLIPEANVRHLMVREEVIEAVDAGEFNVYAIKHVDQAMHLLTGVQPGVRDEDGRYPADTLNARVAQTLAEFEELARRHGGQLQDA